MTQTFRSGGNHRLILSILWSAGILVTAWRHDLPDEAAQFLGEPLLNLDASPMVPLWSVLPVLIFLESIGAKLGALFRHETHWAAMLLASLVVLICPFNLASGILFSLALLAGRMLFSLALARDRATLLATPEGIRGIFFISGMAALIYQVAWQRKLIGMLGADGQSVTVIVAVFMGGLGIGAWLGDYYARSWRGRRGVAVFCLVELAIGVFGVLSTQWIDWVGAQIASENSITLLLVAASLALLLPTTLMGLTLPVLVELLKEKVPGIHENVGKLYALNALGSATAAFIAAILIFRITGLQGATRIAATLNALTALLVFIALRSWPTSTSATIATPPVANSSVRGSDTAPKNPKSISWQIAAALAALTGYISISQEILIIRMMSWATAAQPWTFGLGVGMFLLGLGWGSYRLAQGSGAHLAADGQRVWIANAATLALLVPLSIRIGGIAFADAGAFGLALTLGIAGFLGGRSLPLICGQMRPDPQGRVRFGIVYAFNIAGSVTGAVLTGYVLFEHLTIVFCCILLAALSLAMAYLFARLLPPASRRLMPRSRALLWLTLLALPLSGLLFDDWHSRLHDGLKQKLVSIIETRAGIIAVEPDAQGDIVIGGGAYDGRFNVDLLHDSNLILRPYIAMALHDNPRQVLEIGLSSGSWAKVMLSWPCVEEMTSVEINHGYIDLIRGNDIVRDILTDPRVRHVVADGRKWLRATPRQWDVIMINNSFHWREGATLLHSREFLELARSRLKPGGILFLNTTGARAIEATALHMFPEVYRIANGIAAINGTLPVPSAERLAARLTQSTLFTSYNLDEATTRHWISDHMPQRIDPQMRRDCPILSDDAMAAEWGKARCAPRHSFRIPRPGA